MDSHAKDRRVNGGLARRKVSRSTSGSPGAAVETLETSPEQQVQPGDDGRSERARGTFEMPADQNGLIVYRGPDWDVQGQRWEADPEQLREYQQLWLTLDSGWSSLAVLGTASHISEQEVGLNLAAVGSDAGNHPIALLDATGVRMSQTERLIERLQVFRKNGARIIVVLEPLQDNPAGYALAQAVDEIVMVARAGMSTFAAIDRTVELIGSSNIRGIISRPAESKRNG
jgi:hypothetical protein